MIAQSAYPEGIRKTEPGVDAKRLPRKGGRCWRLREADDRLEISPEGTALFSPGLKPWVQCAAQKTMSPGRAVYTSPGRQPWDSMHTQSGEPDA